MKLGDFVKSSKDAYEKAENKVNAEVNHGCLPSKQYLAQKDNINMPSSYTHDLHGQRILSYIMDPNGP